MSVSKNQIKLITGLTHKKFRDESGLFAAEGTKLVYDLNEAFECTLLVVTDKWLLENKPFGNMKVETVTSDEFKKVSNLKNPQGVLAVFKKPDIKLDTNSLSSKLSLALDEVQDPGNLGTIIRIADWFGIKDVICSENCADAFNPKTVQASMGALARVKVHYVNLGIFLNEIPAEIPVYGTFMDGKDVYDQTLTENGIIVMGNEGNGISPEIEKLVTSRLLIPNFPKGEVTSESLNVSVATAIVCAEFRRRSK
ncbi:MAG TPA: RNA methyltransferase [Paludibacter sp.]|nr:RNA methyltransferase [Paludibacter sp.]